MAVANEGKARGDSVRLAWCALLAILGLLGNYFPLSLGFNVDLISGPVFSFLAVNLFGIVPGTIVAAISALATWLKWNHPYAIAILAAEAAFYGLYVRKRPDAPLFAIDLAYWTLIGAPLILLFYYGVMDLPLSTTWTLILKQTLNGLCAVIVVGILLDVAPIKKLGDGKVRRVLKNSTATFDYTAVVVMIPCLLGLFYMNAMEDRNVREALAVRVAKSARESTWVLSGWIAQQKRAVELVARQSMDEKDRTGPDARRELASLHKAYPDFHNLIICDQDGKMMALDPPVDERGEKMADVDFSQRQWFRKARGSMEPVVSDVSIGSANAFGPTCVVAAPCYGDSRFLGTGNGALRLDSIEKLLHEMAVQSNLTITVVDGSGNIVVSTDASRKTLSKLDFSPVEQAFDLAEGVYLYKPSSTANVSVMQVWKEAKYFTKAPVDGVDWSVYIEGPLAPLQQRIYASTTRNLAVLLGILFATNLTSFLLSRKLTKFYGNLSETTRQLPERVESGEAISWPEGLTVEARELVGNFRTTAEALRTKIYELNRNSQRLESEVAERTADLATSNAKFRILFENGLFGVAIFDIGRLRILDANVEAGRMFGYTRDELLSSMSMLDLSAEPVVLLETICALREGSPSFVPQGWGCKKSGDRFPVEIFCGIYEWMGKKVVFSIIHDISDRIEAENKLRESESRWQFALDGSEQGVWDWNPQTGKVYFSPLWKSMLGYADEEIGDSVAEWKNRIHPEDRVRCLGDVEKHLNGFTDFYVNEHRVRCKDGSYRWILDRGKVIARDGNGKPVRVIGTHSDISKRKSDEEQLKNYAEAQRVLLREVNHRVKNNLSTLMELIRREQERFPGRQCADVLHDLQGRILALDTVHSLLSGSEWKPVRISELWERIIKSSVPEAASGAASVCVTPSEMKAEASVAHNLALIARELATNTRKHSGRADGLSISVEIACYGGEAKIRYRDNGRGYPEEIVASRRQPYGVGLGLVAGLAETILGGRVEFENDGGALTTISFPAGCPEGVT